NLLKAAFNKYLFASRKWAIFSPFIVGTAIFLNPQGIGLLSYAWRLSQLGKTSSIGEWQGFKPIGVSIAFPPPSYFNVNLSLASLILLACTFWVLFSFFSSSKRAFFKKLYPVSLSALFITLPLMSQRHCIYLFFPLALVLVSIYRKVLYSAHWFFFNRKKINLIFPGIGVLLFLLERPYEGQQIKPAATQAIKFIRHSHLEGNVLNFPNWGSGLLYELYPSVKVGFDMRTWVHKEMYRRFTKHLSLYSLALFAEFEESLPATQWVMFPSTVEKRNFDKRFLVIFENNSAVILMEKNDRNIENLKRVVSYYKSVNVPFDLYHGFSSELASKHSPRWFLEFQEKLDAGRWPTQATQAGWQEHQRAFYGSRNIPYPLQIPSENG
ncbi:MAG: hypothetical protein HY537_12070, partial [Deltaproteobacteria bacterium]|nr:hypothetical protein [Deltaproteobacteria bacterium]